MQIKNLFLALFLFVASVASSQGLITLRNINGDTVIVDIADIERAFMSGTTTTIVRSSTGSLKIMDALSYVGGAFSCNAFLDIGTSPNGSQLLINKNHVLDIKKKGDGALISLKGRNTVFTTTAWADVIAQAAIPIGCSTGATGANITEGVLSAATTARSVPMNTQDLTFSNAGTVRIQGTSYVQGDGAGAGLATIDSDATGYIKFTKSADGEEVRMSASAARTLIKAGTPVNGTDVAYFVGQTLLDVTNSKIYRATSKSTNPDAAGTGSVWVEFETGTKYQTVSSNGARITYRVLSQTVPGVDPVVTLDKSAPLAPVLTVTGGTVRLKEVRDVFNTAASVNPLYTFNATWDNVQDSEPSDVKKVIAGSGQSDDDTTPQIIITPVSTTQSTVLFNGVSTNQRFIFTWSNVE